MDEWNRLKLVTAPTDDVITLAQAKQHLRVTWGDDDDFITQAIAAARATIEGPNGIGICLTPQTWRMSLDVFPGALASNGRVMRSLGYRGVTALGEILIPLGPVSEITSIAYTDTDGNAQTIPSFRVDYDSEPCRLWPARDQFWPIVVYEPGAVKVTFTAGYDPELVPADLGWAMRLLISHFYEHREAVVGVLERSITPTELPLGVASILNRYRVGVVA